MVLEKALKIKLISPKANFVGNLVNLIQQDCIRFYSNGFAIFYFFWTMIYLCSIVFICFWLLGRIFIYYMATGFTLMAMTIRLYQSYSRHTLLLQKERDNRVSQQDNILKNMRYIKFGVLENFFCKFVHDLREKEIARLKTIYLIVSFLILINWMLPGTCLVVLYTAYFRVNKSITLS